jgi:hypothetical protein
MRVLVATGRCAERIVKESVGQAADGVNDPAFVKESVRRTYKKASS